MQPTDPDLAAIAEFYGRGRYLEAHGLARTAGPLETWRGPERRVWAGRLAANLGAPRRAQAIFLAASRESPDHARVAPYAARTLLERRGPYEAWRFLRRTSERLVFANQGEEADWFSVHAAVLASVRDFERAELWIERALALAPDDAWIHVEKGFLRQRQGLREEAERAFAMALERHPGYRPAVQASAEVLLDLGRRTDAIELLRDASGRLESGYVDLRLARILFDEGEFDASEAHAVRASERLPLAERSIAGAISGLRAEIAYRVGRREDAILHARASHGGFYANMADRLAAGAEGSVRSFDLPFVAQIHKTCGPATLAMIGPWWSKPIDHLTVAQAICYDGTPDHVERSWAESNGWFVREFSVDWDAAVALIEGGVPFALNTVAATSAHLQAVVGVDTTLRTLLIQDPSAATRTAAVADPFLASQSSTGPRGMAMVPVERAELLRNLPLPDEEIFDEVYRMKRALEVHDRDAAERTLRGLEAQHEGHPLVLRARWTLHLYDADTVGALATIERLRERFPDDDGIALRCASALGELGRDRERQELLRERLSSPHADPIFRQQLADDLRLHAAGWPHAEHWLRSAIRRRPEEAIHYRTLADLRASQQQGDAALELLRIAACLEDTHDPYSEAYFEYARVLGRSEEALHFLEQRCERLGDRSAGPAKVLFDALCDIGRTHEAIDRLDAALKRRPDDPELLLFAASQHARRGAFERAHQLLEAAEGRSKRSEWLATRAELGEARGLLHDALADWREASRLEPLSVPIHRRVASLLRRTECTRTAIAYLDGVRRAAPAHRGLCLLHIEWLRREDAPAAEACIRELIERRPNDAWAHRELALCLLDQARAVEGVEAARAGLRLDPRSSTSHHVAGALYEAAGDRARAGEHYRECIRLEVDRGDAIRRLVELSPDAGARREALRFVESQLAAQPVSGEAIVAYREAAAATLSPDEVLARLQEGRTARPDLFAVRSQLVKQLLAMGRLEDARSEAGQVVERFPLVAEGWVDLGDVERARGRPEKRIEALEHACRIAPAWDWAVRELGVALEQVGARERAREVLESAVQRSPRDPFSRGCLASVLRAAGDAARALEELEEALRLDPSYTWAWQTHAEWTSETPSRRVELAKRIVAEQAGDVAAWLALCDALPDDAHDERLAALERALALDRDLVSAWDRKMTVLSQAGRSDEALGVPDAAAGPSGPRPALLARAAWVLAQRGELALAVERMRAVLATAPSLVWGWKQLASWCETLGDAGAALESAQAMVRLEPGEAEAWAHLAWAQLTAGDREGARTSFERAFALVPDHGWVGMNLFDLQLEQGRLEEARVTCAALGVRVGGEFVDARRIQIDARLGDLAGALSRFESLCEFASEDRWPLVAAADALVAAGAGEQVLEILGARLVDGNPAQRVADLWAARLVEARRFRDCERQIARLLPGARGVQQLQAYVRALGDRCDRRLRGLVRALGRRHRRLLRETTLLWALYGYALLRSGEYAESVRWMAGWEKRPDLESWMLHNLAIALFETRRRRQALRVCAAAVQRFPRGETASHRLWLASEAAVTGRGEQADSLIADVVEGEVAPESRVLLDVTRAVRALERAAPAERGQALRDARAAIDRHARLARRETHPRRVLRRGALRVGRLGGPRAWPWTTWRLATSHRVEPTELASSRPPTPWGPEPRC